MLVRTLLDDVEQRCSQRGAKAPNRALLRQWAGLELGFLVAKRDWQWSKIWLDPLIQTAIGVREYDLPKDFPANFCPNPSSGSTTGYDVSATKYAVTITDGTTQTDPDYLTPEEFYSRDLDSEDNARPTRYTIITKETGRRWIVLSAPPDLATYEIRGLYKPTEWTFEEMDDTPPMPNPEILIYAVMKRINGMEEEFEAKYQSALMELWSQSTADTRARVRVKLGQNGCNDYSAMRRF